MIFPSQRCCALLGAAAASSHNNPETAPADDVNQRYRQLRAGLTRRPSRHPFEQLSRPQQLPAYDKLGPRAAGGRHQQHEPSAKTEPERTAGANPTPSTQPAPGTQPDNTKVNERDRSSAALTPLDQRNNETDLKITQQVRQAVMADGSLSFTAKNVKIITQAGKVTLRGPVKTAPERDAIEAAARKVAGVTQVDNQIEVKK